MFHVLVALAEGEKHGYAILKEVVRRTGGKVRLSAGSLYGIIRRLHEAGMIAESHERPEAALDDDRRRYYLLTPQGREMAMTEARRMEEIVALARAKNLLHSPEPA